MDWIRSNWRIVGAAVVAVIWAAQLFGPAVVHFARNTYAKLRPEVDSKTTIFSAWPLLAFALLLGSNMLPDAKPVEPPTPQRTPDLVDRCGIAGRALLADALEDFAGKKFDSDQAREDAINEKIHDVIEASFVPVNEAIAEAIKSNRVTEVANQIRKGELRE
jgi:hypothetical protein